MTTRHIVNAPGARDTERAGCGVEGLRLPCKGSRFQYCRSKPAANCTGQQLLYDMVQNGP